MRDDTQHGRRHVAGEGRKHNGSVDGAAGERAPTAALIFSTTASSDRASTEIPALGIATPSGVHDGAGAAAGGVPNCRNASRLASDSSGTARSGATLGGIGRSMSNGSSDIAACGCVQRVWEGVWRGRG